MNRSELITTSRRAVFAGFEDGTGLLLHLDRKEYFVLNTTAAAAWRSLTQGPRSVDDLSEDIVREFEVSLSEARRDVLELLEDLLSADLVERAAVPPR